MTDVQLEVLFLKAIAGMAIYNKLNGYTKDKLYNWRKGRKPYNRAEMLDVLSQLNIITITLT